MRAIQVKYLPATETKGARWRAWVEGHAIHYARDYSLEPFENARGAAALLAKTLGWDVELLGGTLPNGDYCFLIDPRDP